MSNSQKIQNLQKLSTDSVLSTLVKQLNISVTLCKSILAKLEKNKSF